MVFGEAGDSGNGLRSEIDADSMMLNALQMCDRAFWRQLAVGSAEALRNRFNLNARHRHRFHPAQHTEFGFGIAQAIEDHYPHQRFDVDAVSRLAKHPAQLAETQRFPQFVQRTQGIIADSC